MTVDRWHCAQIHARTRLFVAVDGTGMKYLSRIAEVIHGTEESNGRPISN
jgi:hypothetical protein